MQVDNDNFFKLTNYQPLPTNRNRRSKLYRLKKSKALEFSGQRNNRIDLNYDGNNNKERVKKILVKNNLV